MEGGETATVAVAAEQKVYIFSECQGLWKITGRSAWFTLALVPGM
jgi:hypothetical protein